MKKIITIIIVLVVALAAWTFFGKSKTLEAPAEIINSNEIELGEVNNAVKEFTVSGKNFSFTPALITVKKGDRVKITFENSQGFHDFKIDEYGVATKQTQSPTTEVLEFVADKAGSFEYYCSVGSHRAMGMKGVLKVE